MLRTFQMPLVRLCIYNTRASTGVFGPDSLLRNEFNFWNVHGIMNTSGLVQSK